MVSRTSSAFRRQLQISSGSMALRKGSKIAAVSPNLPNNPKSCDRVSGEVLGMKSTSISRVSDETFRSGLTSP